jgi:hypothetical protein
MNRALLALCALALAVPAAAQDASGRWDVVVTTTQGQNQAVLVLKKDGEALTGTAVRPQGEPITVTGTQKGAEVVLSMTVPTEEGPLPVTMRGKQDGESMKGTITLGPEGQGDWTATRTAAPAAAPAGTSAVDLSGTWALQVVIESNTRTPTAVLKQDADKLTGTYKSQIGEAPVTGRIQGNEFSFQLTLTFDGTPVTIVYTGTVEENAMKGSVSAGDLASGTFTGKRQEAGR